MRWSPEQQNAIEAVKHWYDESDEQVFRLFGYAGTGKTTLAKHLAEQVEGTVLFATFTGKAAHVLMQKGCHGASTIHSLIYKPKDRSRKRLKELREERDELASELRRENEGELPPHNQHLVKLDNEIARERDSLKRPAFALSQESILSSASLLIVDEVSMVDEQMGEDLLTFGCRVLVLGDPAQLPPVFGAGFFTKHKPNLTLTEIHRQAQGSPIIKLATSVRLGNGIEHGEYGESAVIKWSDMDKETAIAADQIIVGTHKLRRSTNARIREIKGYDSPLPMKGDRLVCLRNDHDVGLLNGSIWIVNSIVDPDDDLTCVLDLMSEDGTKNIVCDAHTAHFYGREMDWWERKEAQEFDFGYALTCHKSQGSQWNNVLIFDESGSFRESRNKWLYTAITRAAKRVVVAKK